MNNYQAINSLIAQVSGQENIITIPKVYVRYCGDHTTALVLNQIVFFSDKSKRTDGYFYKSYKEWEEESLLTERQVRLSVKKLKEMGVVETKLMKANGAPTVHYKLRFDVFAESILTFCQNRISHNVRMETDIMSGTLTDITTDNNLTTTTQAEPSIPLPRFFEQVMMIPVNKLQMDSMYAYLDDFNGNEDIIKFAIKSAADKNKRNFAFVEYLLREWHQHQVDSVQAAINHETNKFAKPQFANSTARPRNDFDKYK